MFQIFDFSLSDDDVTEILTKCDCNFRAVKMQEYVSVHELSVAIWCDLIILDIPVCYLKVDIIMHRPMWTCTGHCSLSVCCTHYLR